MAAAPIFTATPKCAIAQISSANTARDGSGTIGTVYTAGSSGSKIERVHVCATGTTTAGVIRLFIHDGSNARLYSETLVTAITPSASIAAYSADVDLSQSNGILVLPTGYSLRASTHNGETFNVFAIGADY